MNRHILIKTLIIVLVMLLCPAESAFAGHPLITDDTFTQGKGKFQLEINGQIGFDDNHQTDESGTPVIIKSQESEFNTSLTYGVIDSVDLIVGFPYEWKKSETGPSTLYNENGLTDLSIAAKWRFLKKEPFTFAVKPGITLPTGNMDKYLGTGRITGSLFFITSVELQPFLFHLNLGYIKNVNDIEERVDLYHASLAGEWQVLESVRLAVNGGVEENSDATSSEDRVFILGGLIYSPTENLDFDAGIKIGVTDSETDYMFLGGVTFRF